MPKDISFIPRVLSIGHVCCVCLERKRRLDMINQPCKKSSHIICKTCIERIVSAIPISQSNPNIYCQYPWAECGHKYKRRSLKVFLKEKYQLFLAAYMAFRFSGYLVKTCTCTGRLLVARDDIEEMGYNVMICGTCDNDICIDCMSSENLMGCVCMSCIYTNEYTNTNSFNYFFYKESGIGGICDYKIKNIDMTKDIALKQLINRFSPDPRVELHIECPICKVSIYKTEQCNGISHCHVEICYSCGKFSDIGVPLADHWSATGSRGCPRFDQDPFWKTVSDMKCVEGECYGHLIGPCTEQDHLDSILNYQEFRKKQHMYHALKSLLPHVRQSVIHQLPENLHKYLPSKNIFVYLDDNPIDYDSRREYLPILN